MSAFLLPQVLLETMVWTALLIAAVLLVRRPVARWFGPQIAYALWAIPMARLILPPLELPGWMQPAMGAGAADANAALLESSPILDPAISTDTMREAEGIELAVTDGLGMSSPSPAIELDPFVDPGVLIELGLAVWFIGAAIFLYLRFGAYFRLRDALLEGGSEVGRARIGKRARVRLIETDGARAPLAFGVIDKVIALPPGFLAQPDRRARDLALAHEMAHHEGRDLLVNVLVQPLFAIHWWNPLGRYGWMALRRDQEAACDARVMARELGKQQPEARPEIREAYANLIVSFAANPDAVPHHALTAPMACPVLGDKSIIHRLRSLNMNETTTNRRLAGRIMLGVAVLALPLTASISYAASEAPKAPDTNVATAAMAPSAPKVPVAPTAPTAPSALASEPLSASTPVSPAPPAPDGERSVNKRIIVIDPDGKRVETTVSSDSAISEQEIEEIMVEVRTSLAEARVEMEQLPRIIEQAMAEAHQARANAIKSSEAAREQGREVSMKHRTIVEMKCDRGSEEVATTRETPDGGTVVLLCEKRIMANALKGLKEAREAISRNQQMSQEMRSMVTSQLDREIERWQSKTS